jgi:hypothetical protein
MQCNIDQRGARFRRLLGYFLLGFGISIGGAAYMLAIWWLWILAAAIMVGGAFALFEARKKWCAVRAMGIQTRI